MRWAAYGVAAFIACGAILTIRDVGKPRKPITGGLAAAIAVVDAAIIVFIIIAAGRP